MISLYNRIKQKCASLNENSSHMLICLNAWSLLGGTVWEGVGGVALLEEMWMDWGWILRFQNHRPLPVGSLLQACGSDVSS